MESFCSKAMILRRNWHSILQGIGRELAETQHCAVKCAGGSYKRMASSTTAQLLSYTLSMIKGYLPLSMHGLRCLLCSTSQPWEAACRCSSRERWSKDLLRQTAQPCTHSLRDLFIPKKGLVGCTFAIIRLFLIDQ